MPTIRTSGDVWIRRQGAALRRFNTTADASTWRSSADVEIVT
jgi:hypothetical protein